MCTRRARPVSADSGDGGVAFPPVTAPGARVLVLGSMPGRASLAARQYYAHPRNAFWTIMDRLLDAGPQWPYDERLRRLRCSGVALWDVIHSCRRRGSLDSAIVAESVVTNDFNAFFRSHTQLRAVLFNGGSAERLFRRFAQPSIEPSLLPATRIRLPSTSPAYAAMRVADKRRHWSVLRDYLGDI